MDDAETASKLHTNSNEFCDCDDDDEMIYN